MYEVNKLNQLIKDKTILIYNSFHNKKVKGYIYKVENQMANFLVYAPTKLSLFQSWNVSVENLLKNSTITEKKANW